MLCLEGSGEQKVEVVYAEITDGLVVEPQGEKYKLFFILIYLYLWSIGYKRLILKTRLKHVHVEKFKLFFKMDQNNLTSHTPSSKASQQETRPVKTLAQYFLLHSPSTTHSGGGLVILFYCIYSYLLY